MTDRIYRIEQIGDKWPMSNKKWKKLNPIDQLIQRTLRLGMNDGVFLTIEYIYGFEKFNTHAYHNYETWAGGYRVSDPRFNIVVEREDMDDAINEWAKRVEAARESAQSADAVDPVGRKG